MVQHIKLMESLQNYLPVVPSPDLLEMFKQTTYYKINSLDLANLFYHTDVFLGMISSYFQTELLKRLFLHFEILNIIIQDNLSNNLLDQDLYIPYEAVINIWNNLIFGNLPHTERLASNLASTFQRFLMSYHRSISIKSQNSSNKFWKMFDSAALSLHKALVIEGSQKVTRHLTRVLVKYIGQKHTTNQTTFNPIEKIWEHILQDYRDLDLNANIRQLVGFIEDRSSVARRSGSTNRTLLQQQDNIRSNFRRVLYMQNSQSLSELSLFLLLKGIISQL